jgi:hypothetical protein
VLQGQRVRGLHLNKRDGTSRSSCTHGGCKRTTGGRLVAIQRCARIKGNGERCKAVALPGATWCYAHDPDRADARRRSASKAGKRGGRGRPGLSSELAQVKALLEELTHRVLGEDGAKPLETGPAAVANQLINTRLRAIELERRLREADEFEERLDELEDRVRRSGWAEGSYTSA